MQYRNGQRLPLEGGGALRLSVNPRARRLSIRIDARAGEAVAVAPSERRLGEVVAFARTKSDWIKDRLAARVAGAGLILFALACLRYGLVRSLLTYSAAALVALVLIGVFAGQSGILLWPAVVAHLIAVIALTREVRAAR